MKCPTAREEKKIIKFLNKTLKKFLVCFLPGFLPKNLMKTETFFLEKSSIVHIYIYISLILDMAWTLCCVEC